MSCGLYFYSSAPTCQCHRASPSPPGLVVMLLFYFSFPDTRLFMTCVLSLGTPVTHPTTNQKPTQAVSHPSLALITPGTNNSHFTQKSGWRHLPWFQQTFPPPRHRRRPPRRHTSPLISGTHPGGKFLCRISVENFGALEKCGKVKRGCLGLGLIDFNTTLFPPRFHHPFSTFLMYCGFYFYSSAPTYHSHRASPSPPA